MDHSIAIDEKDCNKDEVNIIATAPGSNSFPSETIIEHGETGVIIFDPPTVTNPSSCTDAQWLYKVDLDESSLDSPLPKAL